MPDPASKEVHPMSTSASKPSVSRAPKGDDASSGTEAAQVSAAQVAHLTVAERAARGRAVRSEIGRSLHADWEPSSDRLTRSNSSSSRQRAG
jgi:hypothetical protein